MPSAGSSLDPIQAAVYATLNGDATLKALHGLTGIFDYVPQAQAFPYIVIGDDHELNDDAFTHERRDLEIRIHVWSQAEGWQEASDLLNRIIVLLDYPGVTGVTGWSGAQSVFMESTKRRDPDGISRQLIGRFRIWLEQ